MTVCTSGDLARLFLGSREKRGSGVVSERLVERVFEIFHLYLAEPGEVLQLVGGCTGYVGEALGTMVEPYQVRISIFKTPLDIHRKKNGVFLRPFC